MITIRRLETEDYDTLIDVWQDSGVHLRLNGRESRESFAKQMSNGLQTILAAELDGKIVGVVLTTHDGRKGWINRLGVRKQYQRQGIGKKLIEAAEQTLHEQGLTVIAALVEHYNEASLGLFQSEGYLLEKTYYVTKRDSSDA
jgi:ribosomal protein S18 acetylase RimI-like enzyme